MSSWPVQTSNRPFVVFLFLKHELLLNIASLHFSIFTTVVILFINKELTFKVKFSSQSSFDVAWTLCQELLEFLLLHNLFCFIFRHFFDFSFCWLEFLPSKSCRWSIFAFSFHYTSRKRASPACDWPSIPLIVDAAESIHSLFEIIRVVFVLFSYFSKLLRVDNFALDFSSVSFRFSLRRYFKFNDHWRHLQTGRDARNSLWLRSRSMADALHRLCFVL